MIPANKQKYLNVSLYRKHVRLVTKTLTQKYSSEIFSLPNFSALVII